MGVDRGPDTTTGTLNCVAGPGSELIHFSLSPDESTSCQTGVEPSSVTSERALTVLTALLAGAVDDPRKSALALLNAFGSLGAVMAADLDQLTAVMPGHSYPAAKLLVAAREACALALEERVVREVIGSWAAVEAWARLNMDGLPSERPVALYLDRKNGLIRSELTGEGAVNHLTIYPREISRRALQLGASAVVLLHNHPASDPSSCRIETEMTRKVADALQTLNITLHDHVIVGRDRILSMRNLGLL